MREPPTKDQIDFLISIGIPVDRLPMPAPATAHKTPIKTHGKPRPRHATTTPKLKKNGWEFIIAIVVLLGLLLLSVLGKK